ncbi:alpha/beta fold hydrolase [Streptomyces sp. NPDC000594]|uniref:alpha/beta fold hydrolase n=1 Tax=Streptomyces sp. NPDC000594 TaxID=3154261 RepID=UPI003318F79C
MPKFTAYDGTELAYHLKGAGEPLICLSGGPVRAAAYYGTLGGLDAHHRLVLLDLRGTGGSAEPADPRTCRWDRQTDDIEALREHLGLDRVHLLAHSVSGNLATLYAARHPLRVRSLTLIAPGARPGDGKPEQDGVVWHADGFDPEPSRAALATLQAPVLVLTASRNGGPRPLRAADLAPLFPYNGRADVHHPWLEDPGGFVRAVRAFLDPDISELDVDGVRLAYRAWGEPGAPPVVLAHGRGDDGAEWAGVGARLAATRRVYAPDFGGHGLSDWPGDYGFHRLRNELSGFIRGLGLDSVHLVGHSMGGLAALLLAAEEPELVDRLVVEEPPPPFPLVPPRPAGPRTDGEVPYDREMIIRIDAELNDPDPRWSGRLASIEAGTLVIGGGPESHVDQEALARMTGLVPGARLLTLGGGHKVHGSRPEEFLAALEEFGV